MTPSINSHMPYTASESCQCQFNCSVQIILHHRNPTVYLICSPFDPCRVAAEAKGLAAQLAPQAEQALARAEASVRAARLAAVQVGEQDAEVLPADLHLLAVQQLQDWHASQGDASELTVGAPVHE